MSTTEAGTAGSAL
uniref:Uncharacterized protein n=1 Tax=Anguilla anguilla TaxID=7936 RepID=A0A0E9VXD3_ANGAN